MDEKRILGNTIFYTLSYAFVRYFLLGDVDVKHWSLFLVNNIIGLLIVFLTPYTIFKLNRIILKYIKVIIPLHIILSTITYSILYLNTYYSINVAFGIPFVLGIILISTSLSFVFMHTINLKIKISKEQSLWLIISFMALHNLFIGIQEWIKPWSWNGFLPPISLIAFIFSIYNLCLLYSRYYSKKINFLKVPRMKTAKFLQVL
jgi:hypothetical protein